MKFHPHEEASAVSMLVYVLKVDLSEGKLFCLCSAGERPVGRFQNEVAQSGAGARQINLRWCMWC